MDLKRIIKHLSASRWVVTRMFPAATMKAIENAIRDSERSHDGELRFAVEGGLKLWLLLHERTPRARAMELFSQLRVWDTERNSGVLIYVQAVDRHIEIIADRGINAKVEQLRDQKVKELESKNKQLTAAQDKLDKGATLLADAARASLQADIERLQKDITRFTEDAQQEIQTLTQQLQASFEQLLLPIIDKVAKEKQVHFVFDAAQSGLVWADPSMDLTADVVKALDSGATAKPAAAPAAAAPATQKPPAAPTQK